jgi:hypothetical protein
MAIDYTRTLTVDEAIEMCAQICERFEMTIATKDPFEIFDRTRQGCAFEIRQAKLVPLM